MVDERERRAGERERVADEREAALTVRQQESDERERALDERARRVGDAVESLEQRTLETIERSRALLALSGERLNRQEAVVKRQGARRGRQQAEVDRSSAESERGLAAWLPDPDKLIERTEALRKQTLTAMEAFAANEEEVARLHEDLAARHPERREEYQRTPNKHARRHAKPARPCTPSPTDISRIQPEALQMS